jgi:hypothetical protein
MTTPHDVVESTQSLADPFALAPPDEDAVPETPFQEINARRARVENAELLAHLRGL